MNGFFTVKEVADKLKVCEESVRRHIAKGNLKGVKIGTHWRIFEEDLSAFINAKTHTDIRRKGGQHESGATESE